MLLDVLRSERKKEEVNDGDGARQRKSCGLIPLMALGLFIPIEDNDGPWK